MKKLQCEICGGSLMMQDGIAVCESCGMKFSKEEVKKMVVELSGPVEIKGPVELIKGEEEKNRLLDDAERLIEAGAADEAAKLFRRVTEEYPTEYRGWFGCWRCGAITGIPAKAITIRDITLHDKIMDPKLVELGMEWTPAKPYANIRFPTSPELERNYDMALSLASDEDQETLRLYRDKYYDTPRRKQEEEDRLIQEWVQKSNYNAYKLRELWKKHDYPRAFREVLEEQCLIFATIPCFGDAKFIYGYLEDCLSFAFDDEFDSLSKHAYAAVIKIPPERMGELEQMALDKHNGYLTQHCCPYCKDHPKLDLFGRCKNVKTYSFHGSLKPLKKTDKDDVLSESEIKEIMDRI